MEEQRERVAMLPIATASTEAVAKKAFTEASSSGISLDKLYEALWMLATSTEDPNVREFAIGKIQEGSPALCINYCLKGGSSDRHRELLVGAQLAKGLGSSAEVKALIFCLLTQDESRLVAIEVIRHWISTGSIVIKDLVDRMAFAPPPRFVEFMQAIEPYWHTSAVKAELGEAVNRYLRGEGQLENAVVAQLAIDRAEAATVAEVYPESHRQCHG